VFDIHDDLDDNMMKMKLLGLDSAEHHGKTGCNGMIWARGHHTSMIGLERVMISSG